MWIVIGGAAVIGALVMGRTKPKTRLRKSLCLGVHSGRSYKVEENLQLGFAVVHTPGGGIGVFHRQRDNTLSLQRAQGHPDDVALMRLDFEPPEKIEA